MAAVAVEETEDTEKKKVGIVWNFVCIFFIFIKVLETILKELRDPDRNMHNFDPGFVLGPGPKNQ